MLQQQYLVPGSVPALATSAERGGIADAKKPYLIARELWYFSILRSGRIYELQPKILLHPPLVATTIVPYLIS